MLLRLADGDMVLVGADGAVIAPSDAAGAAWSTTMNYVPTFGEGPDQGFTVDRNKVENEVSRRP
jgi:hypothetical protein